MIKDSISFQSGFRHQLNSLSVILSMVSYRFLINTEPGDTTNNINLDGNTYLIVHISYPLSDVDYISIKYSHIFAATLFSLPVLTFLFQYCYKYCYRDSRPAPEPLSRNESGRFGALKSDSTHHFFRNACT
jgi:hypothetical protein